MWGPAIVMDRVVCLFVRLSHANVFETKRIDVWLLENLNRKWGFLIQNLASDSRSEVCFHHFVCFWVGTSPTQTEIGQLA